MNWTDIVAVITLVIGIPTAIQGWRRWLRKVPRPSLRNIRDSYLPWLGTILSIVGILFAFGIFDVCQKGPSIDLSYYQVCNYDFKGHIKAENLKPETIYTFCIHGKEGCSGNDILKGKTGITPNGDGYWDFCEFRSENDGSLDIDFNTPILERLSEGIYDAKFLIKEGNEKKSIAAYDSLLFRINAQGESYKTVPMKILQ